MIWKLSNSCLDLQVFLPYRCKVPKICYKQSSILCAPEIQGANSIEKETETKTIYGAVILRNKDSVKTKNKKNKSTSALERQLDEKRLQQPAENSSLKLTML